MTIIESTQCNHCISMGGGDCATCEPGPNYIGTQPTFNVGIGVCEFQKRWETSCINQICTSQDATMKYVSYSCALFFCKYPERKCEVKK